MNFLQQIRPSKEAEVRTLRAALAQTKPARAHDQPVRDFVAALRGGQGLIAEIKHKSPSHPDFQQPAAPATLARAYRRGGADAVSIVTDAAHFGTSLADVAAVRAAVPLPVLVKDFVIDEVQLTAAWAGGADAALLIVQMLDGPSLGRLLSHARTLGLHILTECHDRHEIDLALTAGARIVGVNNRNLASLTTDLEHGTRLMPRVPPEVLRVSESGLYRRADVERMAACGADAFLVGHALLQSRDPGRRVAELCGRAPESGPRVKVCGITCPADAVMAHAAGASLLGVIFAPSARRVDRDQARRIRSVVPAARLCGVFVDAPPDEIAAVAAACDLDLVQLHGNESPAFCAAVRTACGRPVIKALSPENATPAVAATYTAAAYFLVDLPKTDAAGGPTVMDCRAAAGVLARSGYDVFLAGGLTPGTVRRPDDGPLFGYDVAGGVEAAPGMKDPDLTRQFIKEATT